MDREILLSGYKIAQTSRLLDKQMLIMLRQGKSYFHIGCMGHEAIQVALGLALTQKRDWLFPYYRDLTFCLSLGMSPLDVLLGFLGKRDDPSSGGRQMPMHYGHKAYNIPTSSSSTGTQFLQAVGCAFAEMRDRKRDSQSKKKDYAVTVVCAGEGTTSQGDFHEALSWAAREQAPIVFLIENNGYAISVPISEQRPGTISKNGQGYERLATYTVDGCNFVESFTLMQKIVKDIRAGQGPVLVDANVVRLLPHSSSDDDKKYRNADELIKDKNRDPVLKMQQYLISNKILNQGELDSIDEGILNDIREAQELAEAAPNPERSSATAHVWSDEPEPQLVNPSVKENQDGTVLVDAINLALQEEMARNEKVLVFGQDVAKGKGGVFTATRELSKKFGDDRCFNAPLAESSIVGVAIGLAFRGYRPVPEIQFGDYVWTAMMQIRNELSTIRYRSNNMFNAPVVIRMPVGGYIHGGLCHSQNIEATFAHFPGLKIALPSNALDAYGLLKAAIRGSDPVLFLEHKSLYRQNFAKSVLPQDDWVLPFGKAAITRPGNDLTIVTYGALVYRALQVAKQFESEGVDIEIIDLRTIRPYDFAMVKNSVMKTGKVLVLYEDNRFMGFGAEIAAEIAEKCYEYLDGPVSRLAGLDVPIPYHWDLEDEALPQIRHIYDAAKTLANY